MRERSRSSDMKPTIRGGSGGRKEPWGRRRCAGYGSSASRGALAPGRLSLGIPLRGLDQDDLSEGAKCEAVAAPPDQPRLGDPDSWNGNRADRDPAIQVIRPKDGESGDGPVIAVGGQVDGKAPVLKLEAAADLI